VFLLYSHRHDADKASVRENLAMTTTFAELFNGGFSGSKVSDWLTVDQETITRFGLLTRDPDPNHIDAEWATANSLFGGPIAFGFQSLSMLTFLAKSAGVVPEDAVHVINYGFDHVRFLSPVRAGKRIRGHFSFAGVKVRHHGQILITYDVEVEIEDEAKPAISAKWLALYEGEMPA